MIFNISLCMIKVSGQLRADLLKFLCLTCEWITCSSFQEFHIVFEISTQARFKRWLSVLIFARVFLSVLRLFVPQIIILSRFYHCQIVKFLTYFVCLLFTANELFSLAIITQKVYHKFVLLFNIFDSYQHSFSKILQVFSMFNLGVEVSHQLQHFHKTQILLFLWSAYNYYP